MKQPTPTEKEWIRALASEQDSFVLAALHEIRISGSVRMIPYIVDLLVSSHKNAVKNNILNLICDIKTQEAVPYLVESIERLESGDYYPQYIAACWQSGLDFSAYLQIFVNVFIRADYQTALEAFTVIEESLINANDDIKAGCLLQLKSSHDVISGNKQPLYRELIKIIKNA